MKRKLILYLREEKEREREGDGRGVVTRILQSFSAAVLPFNPAAPTPHLQPPISFTHSQKLFNLLCPMFWQIAAEISLFFLPTIFTLFLPLLSHSLSTYIISPLDRFIYSCR
jgi:hypothetical protein